MPSRRSRFATPDRPAARSPLLDLVAAQHHEGVPAVLELGDCVPGVRLAAVALQQWPMDEVFIVVAGPDAVAVRELVVLFDGAGRDALELTRAAEQLDDALVAELEVGFPPATGLTVAPRDDPRQAERRAGFEAELGRDHERADERHRVALQQPRRLADEVDRDPVEPLTAKVLGERGHDAGFLALDQVEHGLAVTAAGYRGLLHLLADNIGRSH
jgi:hypothetical protein